MVGAFPFGDLWIGQIRGAIPTGLHKPFTALMVNDAAVDKVPAIERCLEKLLFAAKLICIEKSHYRFSLRPPLLV